MRKPPVDRKLSTPPKIQDYLNTLPPRVRCLEGALIAASAMWALGQRPLIMDLRANPYDYDHVVALFRQHGHWGAMSKTKYSVLRYREPIYRTVRELAMSYFHEYFLNDGEKTLRSYSDPFDVGKHFGREWIDSKAHHLRISRALDRSPHHAILTRGMIRTLRLVDPVEIAAGMI